MTQKFGRKHFDIKRKMKDLELHVVVVEALHLPKKDEWGSSDAFVVVKLGSLKSFETHVLKNSLSPHWEEGGSFELETVSCLDLTTHVASLGRVLTKQPPDGVSR
jgi:Ca2+-dependent lipid-binding protein